MAYYRVCVYCGAHLDPQEICDCRKKSLVELCEEDLLV
jgi:hypothetical protein